MISALDLGAFDASFASLASEGLFAGVTLEAVAAGLFWKKPAIDCCFDADF